MAKAKKLPSHLRKAIKEHTNIPQMAELVGHFMAAAGGPQMLAKIMWEEFVSAKAGSIIRQRMIDTVLRLTSAANQQLGLDIEETDLLSTEDMERELTVILETMKSGEEQKEDRGDPESFSTGDKAGEEGDAPRSSH